MPEKKQESFTVTDRRLFTSDGEVRNEVQREEKTDVATSAPEKPPAPTAEEQMPPTPTSAEQQAQADAYRKSSKELDTRVELSGHSAKELEMTFERFMASLYMSAMVQLGLMH